ncbi:family 43 glycosylhydrolase [Parabacteroides faecis]|uniref:family 43 glycosylhydrolase n=1 Tax=Parabacteroides faecis TaxID=1217282 RepID=UPI0035224A0F
MKKLLTILLCSASATFGLAQQQTYFSNPVIHGDLADPSVMRIGETYYATGTSSEWAPYYPVFSSSDLVNWKPEGHVFDRKPDWTKSSFWAPEWYYHKGKVYVYYTARKESDNISCIGVAVADSPTGEFKDYGPVVEFGKEAIDAFILEDNGQLYISWKAYGLDQRPIELLACKLTDDGLRLDGEPFCLLRDDERRGMEGQHWFKMNGYYYIIYSVNGCCGPDSDYAVAVARSKKLAGPYEKYEGNPILHGGKDILSIGHGTLTTTPDGRMFYLCHAYSNGNNFYQGRQPHLQEMRMGGDNWPYFVTGEYASMVQPMPFTDCVQKPAFDFADDFTATALRPEWSWNYPYADVKAELKAGNLLLSGSPKQGVSTGNALCLRPVTADYTLETAVVNRNESWKGVVMYGDDKNMLTLGCEADRLKLKAVNDGKEMVLADMKQPASSLYLRMSVKDGVHCSFSYSEDGRKWKELEYSLSPEAVRSLVRWDRISRPGLYQQGDINKPAIYGYCRLLNE